MREVPVSPLGRVDADRFAGLVSELRALCTLADVLAWGRAQRPPRSVAEVVTQDEFTHDVVVELEPRLALVFDVT
ncbi:MAG: hypothetical protein ACJ8AO_18885 [Gemmatimonadaceae bacterium]